MNTLKAGDMFCISKKELYGICGIDETLLKHEKNSITSKENF